MPQPHPNLVLASGSPTRRALLDRLGLPYRIDPADVDETIADGEHPGEACLRLAQLKADTVATRHPGAAILGSDQLLAWEGGILGKPGDAAGARRQLSMITGRTIHFHVAMRVVGPDGQPHDWQETVAAQMRELSEEAIARYVEVEQPFDCAGSMRSEGLGVCLVERMESHDPTAILGLPLIATARLLREVGLDPLAAI